MITCVLLAGFQRLAHLYGQDSPVSVARSHTEGMSKGLHTAHQGGTCQHRGRLHLPTCGNGKILVYCVDVALITEHHFMVQELSDQSLVDPLSYFLFQPGSETQLYDKSVCPWCNGSSDQFLVDPLSYFLF